MRPDGRRDPASGAPSGSHDPQDPLEAGAGPAPRAGGHIVVRGLTRRFGDCLAVAPFDLTVEPGAITGLLGPNGSGKSTLMRCLIGLVRPDAGSAEVDGVALSGDGTAVRRRCTYTPGELHLYGELRGREHLSWFLRGRDDFAAAQARALDLAGRFELPLKKRVRTYSHGMKRQLVIAAALAPAVRVRILDEPSEGLDPARRSSVLDLLEEDAARGTTILLSSHHLGEVDRVCDRLVFMNEGQKLAEESVTDLARRARRFLQLTWPAGGLADAPADGVGATFAAELRRLGAEQVITHGARSVVRLAGEDPRGFLAALAQSNALPAPTAIEYGRMSLADLYRDLYGVEGV